jgi:hypothetical protein
MTPFEELVLPARYAWSAGILAKARYAPKSVTPKELLSVLTDLVIEPIGDEPEDGDGSEQD